MAGGTAAEAAPGGRGWLSLRRTSLLLLLFWSALLLFCEVFLFLAHAYWCQLQLDSGGGAAAAGDGVPGDTTWMRALLLSDPHVLGYRKRHWLDVWWSDWGLSKAVRAAALVHDPDVVVMAGDLLDEGKTGSPDVFREASARYHAIFAPLLGERGGRGSAGLASSPAGSRRVGQPSERGSGEGGRFPSSSGRAGRAG
ncbi:hypothetical protein T484DRAFT_1899196, partial [Baffinella frigidus]